MKKLLVLLTACLCLASCDFLRGLMDFTDRLGNGGRRPDTPYVNNITSMDKVYSFRASSDLLKVADITLTILDAAGQIHNIVVGSSGTVMFRDKVNLGPDTKACILTPEETELAASVTCNPRTNIPDGQYVFDYEFEMSYVVTREGSETEEIIPVVNSQPRCPNVDAKDVPNELHAISLGCTKDMQFNQDNGYIVNNNYWRTTDEGYISSDNRISNDGLNQTDPATLPMRHSGRDYVDLGLSVYWATCNVGARVEEEYGGLYGWGDGSGFHTEANHRFYPCSSPKNAGIKDIKGTRMDIAHCQWGGDWRMPTKAELAELFDRNNCEWKWTDSYKSSGIKGYVVTGKKSGYEDNYIFMPAAGIRHYEQTPGNAGKYGYYWSSELYLDDGQFSNMAYFTNMDNVYPHHMIERYKGLSVRPVFPK